MASRILYALLIATCATAGADPSNCQWAKEELQLMVRSFSKLPPTQKDDVIRALICQYGADPKAEEQPPVGEADVTTPCTMGDCEDEWCPRYNCCPNTGLCQGSSCTVPGGNTQNGFSTDCLPPDATACVQCLWQHSTCFQDPNWHKKEGAWNENDGYTCYGELTCKGTMIDGKYTIPAFGCGPLADAGLLHNKCVENNVHFENHVINEDGIDAGWLAATEWAKEHSNWTFWKSQWKLCGYFPCDVADDCCHGQICDLSMKPPTCNSKGCHQYTGICSDPFTPRGDCPCTTQYRTDQCKNVEDSRVGYTVVDVPHCKYDDLGWVLEEYECSHPVEGCDTWVCAKAPTAAELANIMSKLKGCLPYPVLPPETKQINNEF